MGRVTQRIPFALVGWGLFVLTFAALNYTARFAGPKPPKDVAYRWESSIGAILQFAVVFGIALLIARGRDKREVFALRRPASWKTAAKISAGIVVAVMLLAQLLAPFVDPESEQGLTPTYWDASRAAQFAGYALAVVIIGPIVEELMFRGAGYSLLEPFGRWTAILVVGIGFGFAHGLIEGLPIITAFGLGLAFLRSRTQSLYPCVILHAGFNAAALALGAAT